MVSNMCFHPLRFQESNTCYAHPFVEMIQFDEFKHPINEKNGICSKQFFIVFDSA